MKVPLYLVLLMLVGAFVASPAIAQDEAAAEDSTIAAQDAAQATDEAVQATEEAAQASEDAAQATEDAVQTTEDAAQATEDAAQATEDAAQATEDAAQATEDAVQTTEDAAQATEDAVQTTEDAVQMTEDSYQSTQDSTTVEWVVNEAPDDASVTLKGRLVESLGENEYVFEDETGTVQVEIDEELLSADQFQSGVEVEIVGAVDKDDDDGIEIDVEQVNVV